MAAEGGGGVITHLTRVMDDFRRALVLRIAESDREEHRDIDDALENDRVISTTASLG